jgi:hypothetical protein
VLFTSPTAVYKGFFFFCILTGVYCCLFSWWQPFWLGWDVISLQNFVVCSCGLNSGPHTF